MGISSTCNRIHPLFYELPVITQEKKLKLIETVNQLHLHCDDEPTWSRVHFYITEFLAVDYFKKIEKRNIPSAGQVGVNQQAPSPPSQVLGTCRAPSMISLTQFSYAKLLQKFKKELDDVFCDPTFVIPTTEALQTHILSPLSTNSELVEKLCVWIIHNAMHLPLGTHLLTAYRADMAGSSAFAKNVLKDTLILPEALSQNTISQMEAFLAEVARVHCRTSMPTQPRRRQPTVVILSVKNGAGGHTAPAEAMAARLKELGWLVVMIHYDTDLSEDSDPFQLLGITFEDGSPMTETLFFTRWIMQKQNRDVSYIVTLYKTVRSFFDPDLFTNNNGGYLLRKKILPLNPQLIVTTLAYHWSWKSLAYRVTGAKTLLVASDVFFHRNAMYPWLRQQEIAPELRQVHFTAMTDDLELLTSMAIHHDQYYLRKYPGEPIDSLIPLFEGLQLDSQISVIGAPIHPAFDAITEDREIERLRDKWGVPNGAMCVCISRGKLGYDSDLLPALEGYRTDKPLPRPVILQVVCGENTNFYQKLVAGEYNNLGPNITVIPHPLLKPKDFAELRAISTLDDIKAGGGSTFEGWYLISKGIQSMLLLTPGPSLWWEKSNCDAMEKWGVGRTVPIDSGKIAIIQEVMENGLPEITHRFPDWKGPFDGVVDLLLKNTSGIQ